MGIGINAPTSKLHVIEMACFSGTLLTRRIDLLRCVRYKKNIVPINNALSSIILLKWSQVQLKSQFNFRERQFTTSSQIHLLAQDVELIYPEVVFGISTRTGIKP
ncbi:MAG: tail fiber domain-containing protein [Saprospiraceae bacterium]|nr:tail fiber domain-containing protein [Saprospiraceae bacterium]